MLAIPTLVKMGHLKFYRVKFVEKRNVSDAVQEPIQSCSRDRRELLHREYWKAGR